jgi:two-component system, LytTR family, response regulator
MQDRIRTLIVDDERSSRRAIELQLQTVEEVEVVGQAADGAEAVRLVRATRPDLVFLDIHMPDMDGFQVLEELGSQELPCIVFVTAHDEFAVRGFDVNAVDYLLKPVDDRKLRRAIDRVRQDLDDRDERGGSSEARPFMAHVDERNGSRPARYKTRLLARKKEEYFFLRVQDIDWFEAAGNYVRVHMADATHLIRASLSELESTLDPHHFLRIHRSAMVNLDRIAAIQPDGVSDYRVVLETGELVRVGRTYRDSLLQRDQ